MPPASESFPAEFAGRLRCFALHVNEPYIHFLQRLGLDVEFVRAAGALVFDRQGRAFIDCIAGYGNLNLGHHHPKIMAAALAELQAQRPFNWPFISEAHARLAEELVRICPPGLECALIVNSGSEAVDSALKLVRLATGKPGVICARGAWHGFTFGALSVSEPTLRRDFDPLLPGITHVPFGNAPAVEEAITEQTGAVLVEPIQAENGAVVPPAGYLRQLMEICRQKKVILIFDEIKTGLGKTGRLFACDYDQAIPDILLLGKSLGGGVMPIGALVAKRELWPKFGLSFPMSSSSAAGNTLACAVARATLQVLESEQLAAHAARQGQRLLEALDELVRAFSGTLTGTSGRGLLLALHTASLRTATEIIKNCIRNQVLIMTAFCNRSRILLEPPLTISEPELETLIKVLQHAAESAAGQRARDPVSSLS